MTRPNTFVDYSLTAARLPDEERMSRAPATYMPYSTGAWGIGKNIWAPDSTSLSGKRDASRPASEIRKNSFQQIEDDQNLNLLHNSTPTSELDHPSWNKHGQGDNGSPIRHRDSFTNGSSNIIRPSQSQNTSPYLSRQAPSTASSAFTFTPSNLYSSSIERANDVAAYRRASAANLDGVASRFTPRDHQFNLSSTQLSSPYDISLPSSRHSEYNGTGNDYFVSGGASRITSSTDVNTMPLKPNTTPSHTAYANINQSDSVQTLARNTATMSITNKSLQRTSGYLNLYEGQPSRNSNNGTHMAAPMDVLMNLQQSSEIRPSPREVPSTNSIYHYTETNAYTQSENPALSNRRAYTTNYGSERNQLIPMQTFHQHSPYLAAVDQLNSQNYAALYNARMHQPQQQQVYNNGGDQYGFSGLNQFYSGLPPARNPTRDMLSGLRSQLLENFRNNSAKSKAQNLKDIYGHIVEFSGDQYGSRWIQQKLETANSDEKERVFEEILTSINQLTTDIFGNYVIQKLYERGDQVQKKFLAQQMRGRVAELSVHSYGCRVVQTALDHVLADQQIEIVKELEKDIMKCVKDQNGNHVVQKAIQKVPAEHVQFILDAFKGQVHVLAVHNYGCRVMQRVLSHCEQPFLLAEVFACAPALILDQYGNYVIQHIIEKGKAEDKARIVTIVNQDLLAFCKHKFASNVVECAMVHSTDEQRRSIAATMATLNLDGSSPLQALMKDQFGNYVVQKLLSLLKGSDRDQLVDAIKLQIAQLKKYNYGKQIAAIEKLVSSELLVDDNSAAPTPLLTTTQNSPQSSNAPSIGVPSTEDIAAEKFDSKVNVINL